MLDKLPPLPSQRVAAIAVPLALAASYAAFAGWYFTQYTTQSSQANILHEPKGDGKKEGLHRGFRKLEDPFYHGLAPFSARNIKIKAEDGEEIHGWHILPYSYYKRQSGDQVPTQAFDEKVYDQALAERPTLLYFHGTNWTIAAYHRTRVYSLMAARLDINIVAIDYRGYGASSGVLTEQHQYADARSAWDWLSSKIVTVKPEVKPEEVIGLWGHSLGGVIATELARRLQLDGIAPRCLCINGSPSNIVRVTEDVPQWNITLPNLRTLKWLGLYGRAIKSIKEDYDLPSKLTGVTCPVLVTHTTEEELLGVHHFNAIASAARSGRDTSTETTTVIPGTGCTITRIPATGSVGQLVTWLGAAGLHGDFVGTEAVVDMVREVMHLT